MSIPALPLRRLTRADRTIAPVLWELPLALPMGDLSPLMASLRELGSIWFLVPATLPDQTLRMAAHLLDEDAKLVLAVTAQSLMPRRCRPVEEQLEALSRHRCEAVLVQGASPEHVKAGGPFHRLAKLREQGTADLLFIEAEDHATAEWMLHHTPAHALCIPFGLGDQTVKHRLLNDAAEMGTGLIARRPRNAIWTSSSFIDLATDLRFLAGEPAVSAILHPLPANSIELIQVVHALTHPLPDTQRQTWWEQFGQQVQPPLPMPRSAPVE